MSCIEKKAVSNQPLKLALLPAVFFVLFFLKGFSQPFQPFQYKIAIIGNPSNPDIRYDSSTLSSLKKHGFNALQLNIAWGARPADEPLNLEDLFYTGEKEDTARINRRFEAVKIRARIAKNQGSSFSSSVIMNRLLRVDFQLGDGATAPEICPISQR